VVQFLGGAAGRRVEALLAEARVECSTVWLDETNETRTATTCLSTSEGAQFPETELVEPSPEPSQQNKIDYIARCRALVARYVGDCWCMRMIRPQCHLSHSHLQDQNAGGP